MEPEMDVTNDETMDRKIESRRWAKRRIMVVGTGVVVLAVALSMVLFADRSARLNVESGRLNIAAIVRGGFQEYVPITGTMLPLQTVYLDVVEGGRVESRLVEAGTKVVKGQPIVKLSNANLQLDVMYREALSYEQINNARNTRIAIEQNSITVRAQMADVEHQLHQAERLYRRDSSLAAKGMIPEMEFRQSKDDFRYWLQRQQIARDSFRQDSILRANQIGQLTESVDRLETNVDMIKKNLDALVIRAPISGQLSALDVEVGQLKTAGERLGQIDVLDSLKVRAEVDEFYISRIQPGLRGEFEFDGGVHPLVVSKVYPEVKNNRFQVDLKFGGTPPAGLRRGQTLQVRLALGETAESILLPRGAFFQQTGGQWIFVVDASGSFAVKRPIKLGRQNPQAYEVIDGLQPGDRVIVSSYETYGDVDKLVLGK